MSRLVTKPTMWLCAQRRLRSAWTSAQSDQSLHYALNGWLRTQAFFMRTDSDQTGWMRFRWAHNQIVGFVTRRLCCIWLNNLFISVSGCIIIMKLSLGLNPGGLKAKRMRSGMFHLRTELHWLSNRKTKASLWEKFNTQKILEERISKPGRENTKTKI